jgi:hypothetical protein
MMPVARYIERIRFNPARQGSVDEAWPCSSFGRLVRRGVYPKN